MIVSIRVQAKTEPAFRTISFDPETQEIECDCCPPPWTFCSHVDAVLISGERHMLHPADHAAADFIASRLATITPPEGWRGSWRRNRRWRGLPTIDRKPPEKSNQHLSVGVSEDEYSKWPGVCFTGQFESSRADLAEQAKKRGWRPTGSVTSETCVLVAVDPKGDSNKIRAAARAGVPIVTIDEWVADYLETSPFV